MTRKADKAEIQYQNLRDRDATTTTTKHQNTNSNMPPRIVVDGLWRALCPSFDAIVLSQARTHLRRTARAGCEAWKRTPRAPALSRRQNSTAATRTATGTASHAPRKPKERRDSRDSADKLDALSIEQLYDLLRDVRDQEGAYHRIVDLVNYLVKQRGERPNIRHFDALIRANADAEHGSGAVVEELLDEMDREGIIGDSNLYHGVMLVRQPPTLHRELSVPS